MKIIYGKIAMALSLVALIGGCEETGSGTVTRNYGSYNISSNNQQRAALNTIYKKCNSQYSANMQGVGLVNQVVGGSGGDLITQLAASSVKTAQKNCLKEYEYVAAEGRRRGYSADPIKEAAAKRNESAAALWAILAASASYNGGGGYSSNRNEACYESCVADAKADGRALTGPSACRRDCNYYKY